MGEELLSKMNNSNYAIINELIKLIVDEKINSIEELKEYQNNSFKINGKSLDHDGQIEYCKNLIISNSFIMEDTDFMDVQRIISIKGKLKENISIKETSVLLIQLMSLLNNNMLLPYDAYNLIMNNEL